MLTRSHSTMFRAVHSGILSQYHWDKAFHSPGKFKTITHSVRLGVVYLKLVLSTASGVMFCETYLQSSAHHDPLFIYFVYFQVFFNRSPILPSILHPRFPVNLEVLLMKIAIVLSFSTTPSKKLFQSNQRFQAIEFLDRIVSDMDMKCCK